MAKAKKSTTNEVYTYRGGKKILLEKSPDEFVVRALPEKLELLHTDAKEKVSSASTKVMVTKEKLDDEMVKSRGIAPTHHVYYIKGSKEEFLITDRILVTFKKEPALDNLDKLMAKYGLLLLEKYTERDFLFQVTQYSKMNPVKLAVTLTEKEPAIEFAENDLNQRMKKYAVALPTDPVYACEWHLHKNFAHADYDTRSCSRCEEAWLLMDNYGSADVVVGVTDDGCRLNHTDFNAPGKFAGWGYMRNTRLVNNTDVDADPAEMYQQGSNHGTSCAGVIAGEADASLTVGAAPGCRLFPVQWESDGPSLFISDSKFLTVLNYLSDKIDVLSNSWGNVPKSLWSSLVVAKITQLAQTGGKRQKGILFLFAAGNENCLINHTSSVNVPYTDGLELENNQWVWAGVKTTKSFSNNLVNIPGVLHVAALASTAQRSHYSNYGPGIGICAPSSNSHSYWRMVVKGLGISTTTGTSTNVTHTFGGTSSATPLVAGIAALVISANPSLSALQVLSLLQKTASKDLNMQEYAKTPPASYDPDTSWDVSPVSPFNKGDFKNTGSADGTWSPWFGHGRVDAFNAVKKALELANQSNAAALKIIAALVNPAGEDVGNETITLLNSSAQNIDLAGWAFAVKGKKQMLSGLVNGGQAVTIKADASKIRLANNGSIISLLNPAGAAVQNAAYKAADVKSGQAVVF